MYAGPHDDSSDARCRRATWGPARCLTFGPWSEVSPTTDDLGVQIEFIGFAGDCLISGRFDLRAKRLTDQLNAESTVALEDVVLEGLDGHRVTAPTFTIDRSQLCAVVGRGPRGQRVMRIPTEKRRLQAQIGPYVALGRYHGPLGATSLRNFTEREPMVPITDATIAFSVGGILEVRDAPTLIVNRELAVWFREAEEAMEAATAALTLLQRPVPNRLET